MTGVPHFFVVFIKNSLIFYETLAESEENT